MSLAIYRLKIDCFSNQTSFMRSSKIFLLTICLWSLACKKAGVKEQTQEETISQTYTLRAGDHGKKYGLRKVEQQQPYPGSGNILIYSAEGPMARINNVKSNSNMQGSPLTVLGPWDARINYNSDKTVFISNKLIEGSLYSNVFGIGNDIPVNDTIIFASVYNNHIDYSRVGKLNAYYSKMQYYYNAQKRLTRIVNWRNTRANGYQVLDFRFTYDSYGNLLSWKDISANNVGGATYTYDYSKPVKNAYYEEVRPFIEPPFTILQQFGLLPDLNSKHLRKSAVIKNKEYPNELDYSYDNQVIDAAGNLVEYSTAGNKFLITWAWQ